MSGYASGPGEEFDDVLNRRAVLSAGADVHAGTAAWDGVVFEEPSAAGMFLKGRALFYAEASAGFFAGGGFLELGDRTVSGGVEHIAVGEGNQRFYGSVGSEGFDEFFADLGEDWRG